MTGQPGGPVADERRPAILDWSRLSSLRGRIWLLIAVIVLPILLYSALLHRQQHDAALRGVAGRVHEFVRTALVEEQEEDARALGLLRIMARAREMAGLDPGECRGLVDRLKESETEFADIAAATPDGRVFCSADGAADGRRVGDEPWFRAALAGNQRDASGFFRRAGQEGHLAVYGYPVVDRNGRTRAVAFATTRLHWFEQIASAGSLPAGWDVALVGQNGTVVAKSGAVDDVFMSAALAELLKSPPGGGVREVRNCPDAPCLYGLGRLQDVDAPVYLVAGASRDVVLRDIESDFHTGVAVLLAVTLLAAALGRYDTQRLIVAWTEALGAAVRRFGQGDLAARVGRPSAIPELAEIDRAFNDMAANIASADEALRNTERRWLMALEGAGHGVWDWDLRGRRLFFSAQWKRMLGHDEDDIGDAEEEWTGRIHPDDLAAHQREVDAHLRGTTRSLRSECRMRRWDGTWRWFLCQGVVVARDESGAPLRAIGTTTDIDWRHHAEERLRLADRVFEQASEAIVITDENNRIIKVNEAFTRITGYTEADALGRGPAMLKSGHHGPDFYRELWHNLDTHGCWQGQVWNRRRDGEIYPEGLTISVVRDRQGRITNYLGIFSDASALESSRRRMEFLATHDALTALPNRTLFTDRLNHALLDARRDGGRLAVLFVDLDNFKTINDSLGHEAGDLLLGDAAQRIVACVREADTVARLGGDEFAVVLRSADDADATAVCGRIMRALGDPFVVSDQELFVTASIGVSLYPADGTDESALLRHADVAMYRAKELGKNRYQYFCRDMKEMASRRLELETGLRRGLAEGAFRVAYQPKLDLASGDLVGAEALLRWTDPALGCVGPAEFIPVAEKCGLIVDIGRLVIDLAVADIGRWRAEGLAVPQVHINVSPFQLRDGGGFAAWLPGRLEAAALPPACLGIEVTEGTLMEQGAAGEQMLESLSELGIAISIDDFGTGYSSLAYLKQFPITELKIDRSFVSDLDTNPDDRAIAAAVIHMAHSLGLVVVAEGIENEPQLKILRELDCDLGQGNLLHPPLEREAFRALLRPRGAAVARPA